MGVLLKNALPSAGMFTTLEHLGYPQVVICYNLLTPARLVYPSQYEELNRLQPDGKWQCSMCLGEATEDEMVVQIHPGLQGPDINLVPPSTAFVGALSQAGHYYHLECVNCPRIRLKTDDPTILKVYPECPLCKMVSQHKRKLRNMHT